MTILQIRRGPGMAHGPDVEQAWCSPKFKFKLNYQI